MQKVRKAVIPVAGFGTRFLPATKATPKEMMPIVDKPIIQYIVEEAVASGIDTIIFVTGRHKRAIEDHFDYAPDLEEALERAGKEELVNLVREVSNLANFIYIRQKEQLGLGHAILTAEPAVGNEPFAVLLGDELIINHEYPGLKQLIDVYKKFGKSVIGTTEVPKEETYKYGIVEGTFIEDNIRLVNYLVEKPEPEEAPSTSAIIGRYILTPNIFDALKRTPFGKGGELQLTDALMTLRKDEVIYSKDIEGKRHDTGNKLGYIKAILDFALEREDTKDFMKELILQKAKEFEG
ncbi:UTP--glucose-1-phosphate uridylyltransferase [Persephonella hydrogeniphila]|uniref:UTP--glucose-1-phosphate uridylyltransferase n=1 Tax=Persephonella hydrogeniphila TaxID=198703 RepID=A0A285NQD6_9AQUI|nr:UTP--glucose-1-phosphate uridylyltransferase GalU [Persephonella hydrogeniphila]SNZ11428.1 UTP--glucose-1-phosphate uridylyltransferase [Persephonella hydrogeniphila]